MAGMMMPLTNWAPKLAVYSSAFFSRKRCSTSRWRPNTLTSAWPEYASSTCPLRAPVCAHCATKSFCERLAITDVITSVSGMVTSAMRARIGEIRNIITSTPTTVSRLFTSCDRVCCMLWPMLSTSFVTRLSSSPRCILSK